MGPIFSYMVGALISFASSLAILLILRERLTSILTELCRGKDRAAFWVLITDLVVILSSTLLAMIAVPASTAADRNAPDLYFWNIVVQIKYAIAGMIISLLIIAAVIGKSITSFERAKRTEAWEKKDK